MPLCKHHFIKYVKKCLKVEFKNLFRHSEVAYGSMDMQGTGQINTNSFMNSIAIKRVISNSKIFKPRGKSVHFVIKESDIREFFEIANLFDIKDTAMSYQAFKKIFFPQLCHAEADEREGDDMDSEKDNEDKHAK